MDLIVTKFGGSSLASSGQFKKVKAIVESDPRRRFVVDSAPGKVNSNDTKITDLLYLSYDLASHNINFLETLNMAKDKFIEIINGLELDLDINPYFEEIQNKMQEGTTRDYVASRGEYLNGIILSKYLGFDFIDAKDIILFNESGEFDEEKTYKAVGERCKEHENAVIPGFYGSMPNGDIKTFSRGGSDLTGSIVARGVDADLYENWTDVSGFLSADPRIVDNPSTIETITYRELRELSYGGASVLHEEAIFPVISAGIPIEIKNTNAPEEWGTMIVDSIVGERERSITGVAGRKHFSVINIEKIKLNSDKSFHRKLMSVLEVNNVFLEHMPSSIDSISLIVSESQLQGKTDTLIQEIKTFCTPDNIYVSSNIALVTVVGRGMKNHIGISKKVFSALADNDVNIQMIIQGSSELNIIVGVDEKDFEKAINAIYTEFKN